MFSAQRRDHRVSDIVDFSVLCSASLNHHNKQAFYRLEIIATEFNKFASLRILQNADETMCVCMQYTDYLTTGLLVPLHILARFPLSKTVLH